MAEPLTDEHLKSINEGLAELKASREIINRAKQAGLDFEAQDVQEKELTSKLTGIKQAFFPNK